MQRQNCAVYHSVTLGLDGLAHYGATHNHVTVCKKCHRNNKQGLAAPQPFTQTQAVSIKDVPVPLPCSTKVNSRVGLCQLPQFSRMENVMCWVSPDITMYGLLQLGTHKFYGAAKLLTGH